ncbi:hypothetical protein ACQP2F_27545 [Actinoplanes sp. CA-030573]|uniref:hypothetical protein n=1 Tax=Actinoplanes sp. CA-030573 TaxID=3239898 RepID=UPI003D8BC788
MGRVGGLVLAVATPGGQVFGVGRVPERGSLAHPARRTAALVGVGPGGGLASPRAGVADRALQAWIGAAEVGARTAHAAVVGGAAHPRVGDVELGVDRAAAAWGVRTRVGRPPAALVAGTAVVAIAAAVVVGAAVQVHGLGRLGLRHPGPPAGGRIDVAARRLAGVAAAGWRAGVVGAGGLAGVAAAGWRARVVGARGLTWISTARG